MLLKSEKPSYLHFETDGLKDLCAHLLTHEREAGESYIKVVDDFIEEVMTSEKPTMHFTSERIAKVASSIRFYNKTHGVSAAGASKLFLDSVADEIADHPQLGPYAATADEISTLLEKFRYRTFDDARLYFVDASTMAELLRIKKRFEENLPLESHKRRYNIGSIVKLLNPFEAAHTYDVRFVGKKQEINRPESVELYLNGAFDVWKNTALSNLEELISTHEYDDLLVSKMRLDLEGEIKAARANYDELIANKENYEIRFIGEEKLYPSLRFSTEKKTQVAHLSIKGVASVLWYEPVGFRTDMTVLEFKKMANHAFGPVYYTEKKNATGLKPHKKARP